MMVAIGKRIHQPKLYNMKLFLFPRHCLSCLFISVASFYSAIGSAQSTPAYWDVLNVKVTAKETRQYEIDFYRGSSTIYGHVDSVKFINLMTSGGPKYSPKWPIASHELVPEQVRSQLGVELRSFDSILAAIPDSVLWATWSKKNFNPFLRARDCLLAPFDTSAKKASKPVTDSQLAKSVKVLGSRLDSLKDTVKTMNRKMDSLNVTKANGISASTTGTNAPNSGLKPDTVHITIIDSTAYKAILAKYDSVIALSTKKKDTLDNDSTNDHLTLLSAFNFDFTGKLTTSYLGLFNIFAPHIDSTPFGFIGGIEKINYSNGNINGNDTGQFIYAQVNTLVNPLDYYKPTDTVRQGASYLRQYNKYTFSNSNTVWSFYIQPLFKLGASPMKKTGIYLHLHAELLVNQYTRTTNIQTISQDTQMVAVNQTHGDYNRVQNNPIVSNFNFISGYFGAGLTFYLKPFDLPHTHFFFQPTFGFAINSPQLDSLSGTSIPNENGSYSSSFINNKPKAFYLVRASYIQTLSTKSELIIGATFRGVFPNETPQYAVYLGINLDLNSLVKLITGG
jgi:hypothetical protein